MRRFASLLVAIAAFLVPAAPAAADIVRSQDDQGRPITFDVQSPDVDVEWYAAVLRSALHGDEIQSVTITIVPPAAIRRECGSGASACYGGGRRGGRIVVPAGQGDGIAATLLHEYGHHVDASYGVPGVPEPNGTPSWWSARGMAQLAEAGEVARTYALGWDRSIGEIFAEDYAQLHVGAPYKIGWLAPPDQPVRDAIAADLGGAAPPAPPPAAEPATPQSLTVVRRGRLAPGRTAAIPFGLLGPDRRVELRVTTTRVGRGTQRLRVEVRCSGRLVRGLTAVRGVAFDLRGLGPATCQATVRAAGTSTVAYAATLRLTRPAL